MQNLTFYCGVSDPYVKYGLRHFLNKFGFSQTECLYEADVFLDPLPKENASGVRLVLSPSAEDIPAYLNFKEESIPIFKRPAETTGRRHVAYVVYGQRKYPCISIDNGCINIGFDIFSEIGKILAGYYDSYFLKNDRLGAKLRSTPVVDALEDNLYSAINLSMPITLAKQRCVWPDGHSFALVLTHDVDQVSKTHQYIPSILRSIKRRNLADLGYQVKNILFSHGKNDPYWTFETMCALENFLGVKSTNYFLHEQGRVNPLNPRSWVIYGGRYSLKRQQLKDLLVELKSKGFEIGVHGSYKSYLNQQLLGSEKQLIESITGAETTGIRQHYLNYDQNITPVIHHRCGFKYDTSIGFKPDVGIGFRRGTSFPFPIMLPDLTISPQWEIPLIIMDTAIGLTATEKECFSLLNQVERYQGVLTILWHTNKFNPKEFPELFKLYERIIGEAQKRGAWAARASDVYEWLTKVQNGASTRGEAEKTVC